MLYHFFFVLFNADKEELIIIILWLPLLLWNCLEILLNLYWVCSSLWLSAKYSAITAQYMYFSHLLPGSFGCETWCNIFLSIKLSLLIVYLRSYRRVLSLSLDPRGTRWRSWQDYDRWWCWWFQRAFQTWRCRQQPEFKFLIPIFVIFEEL